MGMTIENRIAWIGCGKLIGFIEEVNPRYLKTG
jgi:hypothetical protein